MKRYKQDKLPMLLLDRLADYAKMDWWYEETHYRVKVYGMCKGLYTEESKKTVTGGQLTDLFNAFTVENLKKFELWEVLEIYRVMVITGDVTPYYNKELIKTIKRG